MEALNKLLKNKKTLVFLDFEGTQFSHEIIAIGACKCKISKLGHITKSQKDNYFKAYVKPLGSIGRFVSNMTGITEDTLREQGISFQEALEKLKEFIKEPLSKCAFIVFGSNDAKMILDSINYSHPSNAEIGYEIVKNTIDFLMFISQYIKDDKGNNYSLVNYLKVFSIEPYGVSHDPLNDAIDLKNLFNAVDKQKDILLTEYLKVLKKQKIFPSPVKKTIDRLINGEDIASNEFIEECKKYLA